MNLRLKLLRDLFVKGLIYPSHLLGTNSFNKTLRYSDLAKQLKPQLLVDGIKKVSFYLSHPTMRERHKLKKTLPQSLRGFSIVEFMIAITLSTFIVLGLLSVYSSGKKTYVVQEGLARLQENGRYASHYMSKVIRMAGYQGCVSSRNIALNNIVKNPSDITNMDNAVFGYEATGSTWSPTLPAALAAANIREGTDVIEVWQTSDLGIRLSNTMANVNSAIVLDDPDGDGDAREGIDQDDIFVITDCEVGDMAAAGGNANANSIAVAASNNTTTSLSKAYTTSAKVLRLDYTAFYIKDTGRTNANGAIIYALVARDIDGNELELADGVEDLQLTYGIDTTGDGTADTYQTAAAVNAANNWDNVLSVRAAKLFNTIEDVSPAPQTYNFNGTTVTPDDRLLRRDWTNIMSLRNRNFP